LGHLGIGALAQNPAPVQLAPDALLYVIARNLLPVRGATPDLLALFIAIVGAELTT
jgi:hypothetical protein